MPIIFFGTLSNGIVGALIGAAAARTGYSSALLYRYTFGRKGVVLPNVLMGLTSMGWFSVILNMTRDGLTGHWGWEAGSAPWLICHHSHRGPVHRSGSGAHSLDCLRGLDCRARVPGPGLHDHRRHAHARGWFRRVVEQVVRSHRARLHRVRYGGRRLAGRGDHHFRHGPILEKTASRPWWGS